MADFKKQVLAVLQNIHTSGSFVSEGTEPFIFSGMAVKGVGEISFPVPVAQLKQLIGRAHKAPFGKKVRKRCWTRPSGTPRKLILLPSALSIRIGNCSSCRL